ncbi:hypothetical protein B0H11DRAFT_1912510 [Mycena galericulata]|nr:hypothetical protein B0H11DRAFT_1912510 [Mycena galericulata]
MSATTSPPSPTTPLDRVQEERRRKHAEAQRRYRERNLAVTREKARARMETYVHLRSSSSSPLISPSSLRDEVRASSWRTKKVAKLRRRPADADYREVKRKQKFIARFGLDAFHDYYLPQHKILGLAHLPGLIAKYAREHDGGGVAPPPTTAKPRRGGEKNKK